MTTDARAVVEHARRVGAEITVEPLDVDLGELRATIAFFKSPSCDIIEFFETH